MSTEFKMVFMRIPINGRHYRETTVSLDNCVFSDCRFEDCRFLVVS